ncbi:alcohol dehydrogenase [Agrobacterium tumefaciens]|uniref:zinc-binding dehydrogenase n=1 Tax=Agrobacterium tumefaciens TaxID=358 RepID=UPI001571EFD8|nr:zinc-binding dehydrogenase [Agrobacterium tumefaciens]NSZ03178.1 alcohol dehydrogenase [Agrobacterium tumefaciens]NSZ39793.1 alcohol dehydrogenase [Agrobacterium tumefaciens]NTB26751.1 alcohol dehydrogenase [Agrobacterium tumefaciens]NTB31855.1 alcohol dehydrogenase [Agrobacterium tumefaciens]NTB34300.1 alcohol dehydrogenase [Agrobacterium tumefaciens]
MIDESRDTDDCCDTHRAWVWKGSAAPHDLTLKRIAIPELGVGDVLVRNAVIGLNPVDWKVLSPGLADWTSGHVPGVDGAGIVIAVGEEVPESWLGQRVAYHQSLDRPGSFAEYTPVAARSLMRLPDGLDFETAASFPCPGLTAWLALEKLPLRSGMQILVSGAGGAVGSYLVQLAAMRGLAVTVMSNPRHWDRLRALGAAGCMAGPLGANEEWPDTEITFAAIIDSVDAHHAARLTPALKANGHIVSIQGRLSDWPCPPFGRALSMHEVALGALHRWGDEADWLRLTDAGEQVLFEIAKGRLQAEKAIVRDFSELPRHLDNLRNRQFSGKPLIRLLPL